MLNNLVNNSSGSPRQGIGRASDDTLTSLYGCHFLHQLPVVFSRPFLYVLQGTLCQQRQYLRVPPNP